MRSRGCPRGYHEPRESSQEPQKELQNIIEKESINGPILEPILEQFWDHFGAHFEAILESILELILEPVFGAKRWSGQPRPAVAGGQGRWAGCHWLCYSNSSNNSIWRRLEVLIVVIIVFGEEYLEKTRGADSAGLQGYSKPLLRLGKNPLCKHIWGITPTSTPNMNF